MLKYDSDHRSPKNSLIILQFSEKNLFEAKGGAAFISNFLLTSKLRCVYQYPTFDSKKVRRKTIVSKASRYIYTYIFSI